MFVAIYSFRVKPCQERSFVAAWKSLTELIYRHQGSLGSRLHKAHDLCYIAYAQWPAKDSWKNSGNLPEKANAIRKQLRDCCESIETVYELEVVEDLLKADIFQNKE